MAGIFENIFTQEDENAGLKAIGYENMQDEKVKQFNLQQKNEYKNIIEQNKKDIFSYEDDETVKSKGKYTLLEVYNNHEKYKLVPYAGSGIEAYDDFKIFHHLNTLKNGGILSPEQVQETRNYIKTMREQELRGYTLPARVEQTILESSPYLVEAGIGFATAQYGVGLGAIGDSVLKFGARQSARGFAKKEIRKQLKKQINKDLTKRLIKDSTLGTARFTIEKTPTQFLKKAGEMMIADDIAVTERGQYLLNEAETNPAMTFMKALGDTMIENFSETSGVLFGGVAKNVARTGLVRGVSDFIHKNILKNLPKGFAAGFKNLVEKTTKMPFGKALREFGYNGILEEMGEERIGDFLRFTFDLDSEEGFSGRQLWSVLFPDKEQLITEAIAFGLTGGAIAGGLHGIKRGVQYQEYKSYAKNVLNNSKNEDGSVNYETLRENIKKDNPAITDEKLNNIVNAVTEGFNKGDKYTIDDFMVDTGIVRTPYRHSISNQRIVEHLKETGMKDEDIQTILDFATDEDKIEFLKHGTINQDAINKRAEEVATIKNKYYTQNKNAGIEDVEALENAEFTAQAISSFANQFNLSIEEADEVFGFKVQSMTQEEAEEFLNQKEKPKFQSAMYRSPQQNFEEFYNKVLEKDLEAKKNNTKITKSYYQYEDENVNVRVKHDAINHGENRHKLTANEWEIVLENLTNIENAGISKKKYSNDDVALIKINTPNGKYGVAIQYANGSNQISTAFKSTDRGIDAWIRKGSANSLPNNPVASLEQSSISDVVVSQNLTNIINGIKEKLNPNVNKHEGLNADVYDVIIDKKMTTSSTLKNNSSNSLMKSSNNSLNDNSENYNPNNLKRVIDSDGKTYFQSAYHGTPHIKPIEFQKDIVPNFEKVTDLKKWIEDNLDLLGDVQIKNNNRAVHFSKSNVGRSMKGINRNSAKRNSYAGLKELVENSIYSYTKDVDEKHSKRNNGQEIYHNAFVYDGEVYGIEISIDIPKNTNTTYPYAGHKIKIIKKAPEVNGTKLPDLTGVNISINDIRTLFNPNIKVYYQDNGLNNKLGFSLNNSMVLLKGKHDKSTYLHEFAHIYLTALNNLARTNDKAKEMLIKVNKFLRYNGKEYTTAQHEKFANYFVAYVRTGKAPSYGLKKVFENFKKWLNDLYTNLQLTGEVELSKEAVDLFDELLGNMTLKAQKEISEDIVKKAKHNALLRYQEDNAEKHNVPTNQLTERQRRYRDTAYDILWYALSNTKNKEGKALVKDKNQLQMLLGNNSKVKSKNKGVMSQAEKLEQIIEEIDDVFSGGDGFLPQWGEFFYNPNTEDGNDAELALQALDVIKNKKYLYDYEDRYQELSNEDVKIAELELDYILEEYSNEKGDKTNIVVAFFDWIEEKHPYIQEDLINRWELRTNEIDRYQALSKFQQAKEDLKLYASKLQGYGDYSTQFAEYARAILKRLDFMTERDKEKIFDKLKEYNSFREIERNLDYVMDYAETLQDMTDRRKIAEDIVKEVKQTIHEWKDGIKRTKYTYPANKLFERLRQIERMKVEEIDNLYDELVNEEVSPSYIADEVNNETFYETIERMFVTFKHNGNYYNSTEFLTDLLNKIQSAKFTAKVARDELDFELQMQQINWIDECAKAVDEHKKDNKGKLVEAAQNANAHIMNLNGALKMIFNDTIKNKFSLDYLYAKKDGLVGRDRRAVLDKLKEVFQFKNDAQLYSKFIDMTKPEYEIKQRYTPDIETGSIHTTDIYDKESGQTKATVKQILPEGSQRSEWEAEPVKLSKMEIIYYYIQAKNKISYEMLTDMGDETRPPKGQFDKFEFDTMINSLTPQERLMGDILQVSAEKYYDGLNAYHIKKYHTDLGKVSCYFPRLSETEDPKMLDVFNDYVSYNAKDSSQKHRTAYIGTRIKPANAVAVLFQHIEKANTIIVMGEQLDLMNKVFNNSNLKRKIENQFGEKITKEFYGHVTANLYSGQKATRSLQEEFFAKLANNVIKTQIFAKPQVGLKQILSFMNYGKGDEYVSAGEWLKEFTTQTLTPTQWKKNIDFMLENDFLKDRFTRGGSMDALKRQLENRIFSKLSLLDEFWGLPIRLGDIGAIIWGGKPYIDVLMKKGYTKEQAFKIFIETTVNDQQSSIPSTLSNAQREAKKQAFSTMMYAYQNTPYQYLRSAYTPIVIALQKGGKENIKKAGKMFFIYGWLFPAIFNVASSLSIFAVGGDDDQLKKDMLYAFLGLFGMLPITGDFLSAIIYGLTGDNYSGGSDYFATASRKLNKLARHIEKDKVTLKDIWDSIVIFTETFAGQPAGAIGNAVSGAYNVTQGEVAKGTLKLLGFSDYRAKYVTGEKNKN